jgi:hypothetical protein
MAVDTTLMKAPFISVRVGPPDAKNSDFVTLPENISGLISSFEAVQVIDGGASSLSRGTLVFAEGSGYAGNAPGVDRPNSVLDLVFSKKEGVQFVSPETIRSGKSNTEEALTDADTLAAPKQADAALKKSVKENNKELAKQAKNSKSPIFLLQERNIIEITWGYRNNKSVQVEDLAQRVMRGSIQRVTHRASENGMPMTEVMVLDLGSGEFSKLEPNQGFNFTQGAVRQILNGKPSIHSSRGTDSEPASIEDIFASVAKRFIPNARAVVKLSPEDLKKDITDKNGARIWQMNTSLHEFLKDQAEKLYAHYYVSTDPKSKETLLNLVSRSHFEKDRGAKFTFVWKQGGAANDDPLAFATMKGFSLSLFPEGGSGASSAGVCTKRKVMVGERVQSVSLQMMGKDDEPVSLIQTDPKIKQLTNSNSIARYSDSCDPNDHKAVAEQHGSRMDRALRIDFSTVGIPQLSPGAIEIKNIGVRYSGMYAAISVTHKITAKGGYTCNVTATTNVVKSGGVTNKSPKVQPKKTPDQTFELIGPEDEKIVPTPNPPTEQ